MVNFAAFVATCGYAVLALSTLAMVTVLNRLIQAVRALTAQLADMQHALVAQGNGMRRAIEHGASDVRQAVDRGTAQARREQALPAKSWRG